MKLWSWLKSSPTAGGFFFIILLWLIFFGRILSGTYIYFLDDLKIIYYPLEVAYAAFQQAGQLPLWSPLFGFGQPLLAWGQLGFLTPLHVVLRALAIDPINLLQISVMAYFALGLGGFYIFLRHHRLPQLAAALGATVFTFSGFNIGHLNHVNFYVGTMVLPWLLIAITAFLKQPTVARAAMMSVAAATIALSAQPQITLYIFCIAALYGLVIFCFSLASKRRGSYIAQILALTLLSATIALLTSSLALLPLAEFIPETDRSADLPVEELLDFSYPPSHAITLIAPYFFGDHATYWGAKGFQELAAFTGVIPLLLTGLSLLHWREQRPLRVAGVALVIIGAGMALGRYSPLYHYLVTNHILTTLNIPGRFVFFFTTGIALLSAVGLHDLVQQKNGFGRRKILEFIFPLAILIGLLIPFLRRLQEPLIRDHFLEFTKHPDASLILAAVGIVLYGLAVISPLRKRPAPLGSFVLLCAAAGTLLILGYNYTPVTTRASYNNSLIFSEPLNHYAEQTDLPARLYSRDVLLDNLPYRKIVATQPLRPNHTILQPVTITESPQPCFIIPMNAATNEGSAEISLLPGLHDAPLDTVTIPAHKTISQPEQRVCFSVALPHTPFQAFLRFTSPDETTIRLAIYPAESPSAYLVRVKDPSADIVAASQKSQRIDLIQDLSSQYDNETLLLARHLNVIGQASSARWIGALSIKPYREFIDQFLANDLDKPFTGEGEHYIEANRTLVDMLGITHLAQNLPPESQDMMAESGYRTIAETKTGRRTYRLYENPAAYPKAWLVQTASFSPSADETRHALSNPLFDPQQQVYISGPKPPSATELATEPLRESDKPGSVHIASYQPTKVVVEVETPRDAWLVFSDTTTPQWQTYVDDQLAPHYVANTFMKTAFVPAGQHTVEFKYHSPATERAKLFTLVGLALLAACYIVPLGIRLYRRSSASQVGVPPQTS